MTSIKIAILEGGTLSFFAPPSDFVGVFRVSGELDLGLLSGRFLAGENVASFFRKGGFIALN